MHMNECSACLYLVETVLCVRVALKSSVGSRRKRQIQAHKLKTQLKRMRNHVNRGIQLLSQKY